MNIRPFWRFEILANDGRMHRVSKRLWIKWPAGDKRAVKRW